MGMAGYYKINSWLSARHVNYIWGDIDGYENIPLYIFKYLIVSEVLSLQQWDAGIFHSDKYLYIYNQGLLYIPYSNSLDAIASCTSVES